MYVTGFTNKYVMLIANMYVVGKCGLLCVLSVYVKDISKLSSCCGYHGHGVCWRTFLGRLP